MWNDLIEMIAGCKLARDLRVYEFHKEVERAGVAQERRARSLATSIYANSGIASPLAIDDTTAAGSPSSADLPITRTTSNTALILPPGGVRPRVVTFRHPLHYEVPIAPPTAGSKNEDQPFASLSPESSASPVTVKPTLKLIEEVQEKPVTRKDSAVAVALTPFTSPVAKACNSVTPKPVRKICYLPPLVVNDPRESLKEKFRTKPSTTIDANGCVIQKGFDRKSGAATPVPSRTQSPARADETETAQADEIKTTTLTFGRRQTWQDGNTSRLNNDDLAEAAKHSHRRYKSEQIPSQISIAIASGNTRVNHMPKRDVRHVDAAEAENAIESDDEDDEWESVEEMAKKNLEMFQRGALKPPACVPVLKAPILAPAPAKGMKKKGNACAGPARNMSMRKGVRAH